MKPESPDTQLIALIDRVALLDEIFLADRIIEMLAKDEFTEFNALTDGAIGHVE